MNAIPMLGSLGSIVLVATMSGAATGGRQYIAAGMFLFATLGFVVVQIDRQRKQRIQQVTGTRTEYLRYLGNVRQIAREAGDQQRRALTWHHPDPGALPALAEDRTRIWEHHSGDAQFLHVRYGVCHQPLSLELVPPESAPIDQVDPAAASALHRLLVVHRLQPDLPASVDLRAFDRVEICGPEEPARSLARAMICSATAFHSPEHLVVAVLASEQNLAHWDWVKWLPHGQSAQQSDAVGARRMVSTSLDELAAMLPADLERAAPVRRRGTPGDPAHPVRHRRRRAAAGQPRRASGRRARRDRARPADALGRARGRHPAAAAVRGRRRRRTAVDGRYPVQALRLRDEVIRAKVDQCSLATAEAFARRLTPLHTVSGIVETSSAEAGDVGLHGAARAGRRPPLRPRPGLAAAARPGTGSGSPSAPATAARSSTSTSRSPPSRAWARTAW